MKKGTCRHKPEAEKVREKKKEKIKEKENRKAIAPYGSRFHHEASLGSYSDEQRRARGQTRKIAHFLFVLGRFFLLLRSLHSAPDVGNMLFGSPTRAGFARCRGTPVGILHTSTRRREKRVDSEKNPECFATQKQT